MKIQLSDHFNYRHLLRFTIPSIVMMVFTSIYGVVDGLFVSNFVGSNALSSINIIMPLVMSIGAFGFMLGAGGSAVISKALGEGKTNQAKQYFTTLILTIIACGIVLSAVCIILIRPISYLLGASDLLIEDCVTYGSILIFGSVFFMLQTSFQTFFIVAEKPKLGLLLTVASGITNIFLDFLFIYVFKWGIAGAAWATVSGYIIGAVIPIAYFFVGENPILHFTKTKLYPRMILSSCLNGSSEMVSNISMSFVTVLYNLQMMKLIGESGVAAYSAIMYVSFVFVAIFIGFSIGTAPIISFHYGAGNKGELKNLLQKSFVIICVVSLSMVILAQLFSSFIATSFSSGDTALAAFTNKGFRLYSLSFLFTGFGIFGSAFFTALCNGTVSATLSFLRTLLLPTVIILTLPSIIGINGVWLTVVVADGLAFFIALWFILKKRKQYGYLSP
ncbi:MATE family efflux transporter [Alkaliphilus transvaalensis]|uniref:MATE family efflux transporter n=1 Tax=Alkaliphilus transvaalensis TaxID=114628 RepID=UPI00047CDEA3|nr:MATE family efflux transporter [Alkaliphilus transvaalensis]